MATAPNLPPPDSGASNRSAAGPLSRPLGDVPPAPAHAVGALGKPRVRMVTTQGDLTPAGATHTPPNAAPLPQRGTGVHLVLSVLAAVVAVVFLVLLIQKL